LHCLGGAAAPVETITISSGLSRQKRGRLVAGAASIAKKKERSPYTAGEPAAQPGDALRFVQVPEAAYRLPALELAVLIGLLRFCHRAPFCWPRQETLAAVIAKPPSTVRRGLRGLVARGVVAKRYQRTGKALRCSYAISPGYWVPRKNAKVSAASAAGGGEIYTTSLKEPPVAPPVGGDATIVSNHDREEGAGIEADPLAADIEGADQAEPLAAGQAGIRPPAVAVAEAEIISPGEGRPWRNRQRQHGDQPKPRRKRRRQILTENLAILDALIARRYGPQVEALPSPAMEILEPGKVPAAQHDNLPRPLTALFEGGNRAIQARIARWYQEHGCTDPDASGELLDGRRIA
jgi:predicted transcriptional regulator